MISYLDIYSIFLILIGLTYIAFLFLALNKKGTSLACVLLFLSLFGIIYITGVILQLHAKTTEQMMFYQQVKFFGAPFIPFFILLFSFKTKYNRYPKPRILVLLIFIPISILFLLNTNDYHHLYYKDFVMTEVEGYHIYSRTPGMLYGFSQAFIGSAVLYSLSIHIDLWIKEKRTINSFNFIMIIGISLALLIGVIHVFRILPTGVDLIPFSFLAIALSMGISILKYDILDSRELYDLKVYPILKEGIIVTDKNFKVTYVNYAATNLIKSIDISMIGKHLTETELGRKIFENGKNNFTLEIEEEGYRKHFEFKVTEITHKNVFLGNTYIFMDETEKYELIEKLNFLSVHDGLTGVYNKTQATNIFKEMFDTAKQNKTSIGVIMIDLDNFKEINDTYGHLFGDEILVDVTKSINKIIKDYEIVFGRFGGDEFILTSNKLSFETISEISEKILHKLNQYSKQYKLNGTSPLSASLGIYYNDFSKNDLNIEYLEFIDRADKALYKSKINGKNQIAYYEK